MMGSLQSDGAVAGSGVLLTEASSEEGNSPPVLADNTMKNVMTILAVVGLFFIAYKYSQKSSRIPRSRRALELLQVLVPKRIADEEVGDALEVISTLIAGQPSRWTRVLVWVKVATTYLWTIFHALRERTKAADIKIE